MLSILSTLAFIIPAVIFLLGMWQYSLKGSVRTEETGKLAQEMGLEFTENKDLLSAISDFEIFKPSGHNHRFGNCISGDFDGIHFDVFDYKWLIGHEKSARQFTVTACLIRSDSLDMPEAWFRPKANSTDTCINETTIDFLFDPYYHSSSLTPQRIRQMMSEPVRGFLLKRFWTLETKGNQMIVYSASSTSIRPNKQLPLEEIGSFVREGLQLFALLEEAIEAGKGSPAIQEV